MARRLWLHVPVLRPQAAGCAVDFGRRHGAQWRAQSLGAVEFRQTNESVVTLLRRLTLECSRRPGV